MGEDRRPEPLRGPTGLTGGRYLRWLERRRAQRQYRQLERFERLQIRDLKRERERLQERRAELLAIIENGWLELEDWREFYKQERFREFVLASDEILYGSERLERRESDDADPD